VDASDGYHLWSQTQTTGGREISRVIEAATAGIAKALGDSGIATNLPVQAFGVASDGAPVTLRAYRARPAPRLQSAPRAPEAVTQSLG
jgi:hypothetical protein